jgi:hypothetical protein
MGELVRACWRCLSIGLLLLPPGEAALRIVTRRLPEAAVWRGYLARIEVAITSPCLASDSYLSAEGLPEDFRLSPVGVLEGFPKRAGEYPLRLHAASPCGHARRDLLLRVLPAAEWQIHPRHLVIDVTAGAAPVRRQIRVGATWRDLPYRVDVDPPKLPWLRVLPALGSVPPEGAGAGEDTVEIEIDPAKLSPGHQQVRLRFHAEPALQPEYVSILVRVMPAN